MRRIARTAGWIGIVAAVPVVLVAVLLAWHLYGARPWLDGAVTGAAVAGPVTIARDAAGVPTITAATRGDASYALGYLHGQERFFQMDTLRRSSAGGLSALLGDVTAWRDRRVLAHRFRHRAGIMLARLSPAERAMLRRYAAGVNRGLADLSATPFEYLLLRRRPLPWQAEDTILTVLSMYLDLQSPLPDQEMLRARAERRGGDGLATLLYSPATPLDAPIDGSRLPLPQLPVRLTPMPVVAAQAVAADIPVPGSNNWAVAGRLSSSGGALVANDMHLGIGVPGPWYRARIVVRPAGATQATLDVTGVTLPGNPTIVAGSNGHIAWGFTNSYIDTADAVVLDPVPGRAGWYRTPQGPRPIRRIEERLCIRDDCRPITVEETVWGPVVATDAQGRRLAMRWTADDDDAVAIAPSFAMERAGSVVAAITVAHRARMPQQNLMVGDRAGRIGWTIIGQVPARFGFDGRTATSWADGTRGWRGTVPAATVPVVVDPSGGRLWTANTRVVGGAAYAMLGDGGYDNGARATRIRDRLFAQARFEPHDFLSIQLDVGSLRNRWWRDLMLRELKARSGDKRLHGMIAPVAAWNGQADTGSAGQRLITAFRAVVIADAYGRYMGGAPTWRGSYAVPAAEGAMRRLLEARPAVLVPPGHAGWRSFIDAALTDVAKAVDEQADGRPDRFLWGAVSSADVRHPLARAIPLLGRLTDPADRAVPGDAGTVRAQRPGFGASERFAVSPGHEAEGLFHMPGGQSGNPVSPYYLAGHDDWLAGRPRPFLPGPTRWTLRLVP
ncbi:penicillin acylase family protein [Sphingomonas cynarae]|uniref:Penicillin acylase family protein n=1 Tax=Sphingomonas cynarae TaxID=930197 RepID=A0ABP7DEF5_9SPHN